jgi:hypothetical protein
VSIYYYYYCYCIVWCCVAAGRACTAENIIVQKISNPTGIPDKFRWDAIDEDIIRSHIAAGLSLQQFSKVPFASLLNVDGRVERPVASVPGGDAGS